MKKRYMYVCLFLCLAWTVFIFARSAKSAPESSEESGAVLGLVSRILDFFGIRQMPSEHLIRKLGHFGEYAILAFPAFFAVKLLPWRHTPIFALGYCALVACTDEFLVQNLTVGRSPSLMDVTIDSAGAATVVLVLSILLWLRERASEE